MAETAETPLGKEAVDALVENHRAFLAFLEKRVGRREVAEDILQEAFARGLDKLPEFETEESAVAWFYRVLRNAVIDHHRRAGTSERALAVLAREFEDKDEPDLDMRNATCQCVARLAETLKPEYADALRRVEVDAISVKDLARESGISGNNAGSCTRRRSGTPSCSRTARRTCGAPRRSPRTRTTSSRTDTCSGSFDLSSVRCAHCAPSPRRTQSPPSHYTRRLIGAEIRAVRVGQVAQDGYFSGPSCARTGAPSGTFVPRFSATYSPPCSSAGPPALRPARPRARQGPA